MSSKSNLLSDPTASTGHGVLRLDSLDADGGRTQPLGGATLSIVPHFGHAKSWPTAEALVTFSFAAQDLQIIENGFNGASIGNAGLKVEETRSKQDLNNSYTYGRRFFDSGATERHHHFYD